MTAKEARYAALGPRVAEALRSRFFDAWYVPTRAEATAKILSLIPRDHLVAWGGTVTMAELGIQEKLVKAGYRVIDRDTAKSPAERVELQRQAILSDTFLMSANGISEDGQLVNIDGNGNRLAALFYGPRQVILAAGMNKVVHSAADAMIRARSIAAPLNGHRLGNLKTPCTDTGACFDCKTPDSMCSHLATTRLCKPAGRIKVILIGEELGL
jgi:L-lactate utilization protein LutB